MTGNRNDHVYNPDELSLYDLPEELIFSIPDNAAADDLAEVQAKFSTSCKTFHAFFKSNFVATKLLQHVLNSRKDDVIRITNEYPESLFIKSKAYDNARGDKNERRLIVGSPYQAMVGAMDADMISAILPIIAKIPGGVKKALSQFNQQLPDGIAYPLENYDFTYLIDAFRGENFESGGLNELTKAALTKLRQDFKPSSVTTGHHFNLRYLQSAFKLQDNYYLDPDFMSQRLPFTIHCKEFQRFQFIEIKIIGFLERMISVCDAQGLSGNHYSDSLNRDPLVDFYSYNLAPFDIEKREMRLGYDYYRRITSIMRSESKGIEDYVAHKEREMTQVKQKLEELVNQLNPEKEIKRRRF